MNQVVLLPQSPSSSWGAGQSPLLGNCCAQKTQMPGGGQRQGTEGAQDRSPVNAPLP